MHKPLQEYGDGSHILPQGRLGSARTGTFLEWTNGRLYAEALWCNGPIKTKVLDEMNVEKEASHNRKLKCDAVALAL